MEAPRFLLAAGLAAGLAFTTLAAEGQQAARIYRVGYLQAGTASEGQPLLDMFWQGMRELGHVQGQDVFFEVRRADGNPERLPDLAAELVRLKVDVIVTSSGATALSAKKATQTTPIVMAVSSDAVRQGLVASLAHPGGNVTGLTGISPETSAKRLQILRESLPSVRRVGVLWCGANSPAGEEEWAETEAAAKVLGLQLASLEAQGREDLEGAFMSAVKQQVEAIVMFDCSRLNLNTSQVVALSLQHRLPAIYPYSRFVQAGGLMSYGPDQRDLFRRAATYVDKILKGAKPGDLPVEQPTKFEFVINMKTAKALGLAMPRSVLLRAELIQ